MLEQLEGKSKSWSKIKYKMNVKEWQRMLNKLLKSEGLFWSMKPVLIKAPVQMSNKMD